MPEFFLPIPKVTFYAVVGSVAVVFVVLIMTCVCCCVYCCRRKQALSDIVETEITTGAPPTINHVYNSSSPSSSDNSLPEIVKDEKEPSVTPPSTVGGIDFEAPPCYDEIEQRSLPRRLYYNSADSSSPGAVSYPCGDEKGEKLELQCDYNDSL